MSGRLSALLTDSEQSDPQTTREHCDLNASEDYAASANDQVVEETPPQKKRKLHSQTSDNATDIAFMEWVNMKTQNKQEDSDLLFFRSLLPDLKKLDDRRKRIFKSKIMTTLHDMLDEVEHDASSTTSIESTSSWVIPVNPSHVLH